MTSSQDLALLVALSTTLGLSGCGGREQAASTPSAAATPAGPIAKVVTTRAQRGNVEETVETYGTVEFDSHKSHTVSFIKSGQVAQVLVTPGQPVVRGDLLLRLGPLPPSSLEVEQARINLEYARRNLEHFKRLRELHLATNETVQQAEKDVATAGADLEGLGVDGSHEPQAISAPFSGVVVKVLVTPGSIVHPGEDAMLVAPAAGLVVRAAFEPEDAVRLRSGMAAKISSVFAAAGEDPADAVLTRMHRVVNPETQLLETLIQPRRPPSWMVAGEKVKVSVVVRSAPNAMRVPRDALISRDGAPGIFVVESGFARWRPVVLGVANDRWVEIKAGLAVGTQTVTTGRTSLVDGMAVAGSDKPGP